MNELNKIVKNVIHPHEPVPLNACLKELLFNERTSYYKQLYFPGNYKCQLPALSLSLDITKMPSIEYLEIQSNEQETQDSDL
ncbi:uncharacterized protein VNE69_07015 [Vairimorpha necatrix]|uniref:Uncharacterized protein n=1 Tax=Vairimorpha necatrix TaxID=6039 RepID=A0AAX4JDI8_9MICR